MTKRVFNMGGGAHSDAAYTAFENAAYGSCVANATSLAVSAGSGMSVRIAAGDGIISTPSSGKRIQSDAIETVTISAANATYPRIDSVVVYIDSAVQPTTAVIDNVNGILKFAAVAGTPAASPAAPAESMIQAAIGAGNRYMVLADVKVPNGATSMNTATFTDRRKIATMIDSNNLAKKAVKADNIDFTTMPGNKYSTEEQDTGKKWINGKTIFQKTFAMGGLGLATTIKKPHNISNLDLVIRIQGIAKENSIGATTNFKHNHLLVKWLAVSLNGNSATYANSNVAWTVNNFQRVSVSFNQVNRKRFRV